MLYGSGYTILHKALTVEYQLLHTFVYVGTGSGLNISKIRRLSQADDTLGNGIDYTFIEDNSKFVADDATLRLASVTCVYLNVLLARHSLSI